MEGSVCESVANKHRIIIVRVRGSPVFGQCFYLVYLHVLIVVINKCCVYVHLQNCILCLINRVVEVERDLLYRVNFTANEITLTLDMLVILLISASHLFLSILVPFSQLPFVKVSSRRTTADSIPTCSSSLGGQSG